MYTSVKIYADHISLAFALRLIYLSSTILLLYYHEGTFLQFSIYFILQIAHPNLETLFNIESIILCTLMLAYYVYFYIVILLSINGKKARFFLRIKFKHYYPMASDLADNNSYAQQFSLFLLEQESEKQRQFLT